MNNKQKKLYVVYYTDDQAGEYLRSGVVCATTDYELALKKMDEFHKKYMEENELSYYEDPDGGFSTLVDADDNSVDFQVMIEETELI